MNSTAHMLAAITENIDVGIILVDSNKEIIIWNSWIEELSQISKDTCLGMPALDVFSNLQEFDLAATIRQTILDGKAKQYSKVDLATILNPELSKNAPPLPSEKFSIKLTPFVIDIDSKEKFCLIEIKNESHSISEYENNLFDYGPTVIIRRRAIDGLPIEYISPNIHQVLGFDSKELIGANKSFMDIVHIEDVMLIQQSLTESKSGKGNYFELEYRLRNSEDQYLWFHDVISITRDKNGDITYFNGYINNVTAAKDAKAKIRRLTFFDTLTKLPNRSSVLTRLQQEISRCQRNKTCGSLVFVDLDRFKQINDSYNQKTGDALLKEVSKRIQRCVRTEDVVARMSGDQFVCVITELSDDKNNAASHVYHIADKIRNSINAPYKIDDNIINIGASCGICIFPEKDNSAEDIIKFAETAMSYAKDSGQNNIHFFDKKMRLLADHRLNLERDLHIAISENQLQLYFQPIVGNERNIIAFESLLRWKHPVKGFISPGEFISVAESTGMIQKLGEFVVKQACKQIAKWEKDHIFSGGKIKYLSVNVSPNQFWHTDFLQNINASLERYDVDPRHLLIEITENIFIADLQDAIDKINDIKKLGAKIALDDFGSGYSSLSYLMQLPLDIIKLDRVFIQNIHKNKVKATIVESVCNIAKELNLKVIAEGLETVEELETLVKFNCNAYQGYYFYRPMPPNDLNKILQNRSEKGFNDFDNTAEIPINIKVGISKS